MHLTTTKTRRVIFAPILKLVTFLSPRCPILMVRIRYFFRTKKMLHLRHPKTLNEKILYLSLKTDTTEWSRLADKYAVREYVKECGFEDVLVPLYGVWDNEEKIDFDKLPNQFILKSTHGCGDAIIVRDKNNVSYPNLHNRLKFILNDYTITGGAELHYQRIKHQIIAEKLLVNDDTSKNYSQSLIDYKLWCFNGKVEYIMLVMNRSVKTKDGAELLVYDKNWNPHPDYIKVTGDFTIAKPIPMPNNFDRMVVVAETLSKPFPVVRVDLYNLKGEIYFGEMTFTSLGGMMDYYSDEFQCLAGGLIDISKVQIIK